MLPMYIGTCHVVGHEIESAVRDGMRRYLYATQNQDGGWGLHVEAPSYVFTSVLAYVALRQLGEPESTPKLVLAREWIRRHGGPPASAAWGKLFLAVLGLYEYRGLHPLPPELWLLPESLPFHPSRLWCHARVVALPMSWLYGSRVSIPEDALTWQLRQELYTVPYARVPWRQARDRVSDRDQDVPPTWLLRRAHAALHAYEGAAPRQVRERALTLVLDHIRREDENTSYICLGPVNKLLHTIVWHFARPGGREVRSHLEVLPQYLSQHPLGIRMNGYNSSELWDTAFATQALLAADSATSVPVTETLFRAFAYVEANQVLDNVPNHERYYRHPSRGGWPFSTLAHGWPITDCTAEGLKVALALENRVPQPLSRERLEAAVDLILSWQNDDGGWATYERTRGPRWLEQLNQSDCFADIMIDYSYVECTSASVQALCAFRSRYPHDSRSRVVDEAVERGLRFLFAAQRADGSWEGSWGICFTYGTWFGVTGLRAAGLPAHHPALDAAARFLLARQAEDGGWGERAESCRERRYIPTLQGQAVMTSWALLALLQTAHAASPAVERGVRFLLDRQDPDGSFPPEHIAGVFNKTCAIHYDNYLSIFPLWALSVARANLGGSGT